MSKKSTGVLSRRAMLKSVALTFAAGTSAGFWSGTGHGATYPSRPIKIIVPFAPAGPTDIIARIVAQHLGDAIGGTAVVDNRGGAGGSRRAG